MIYYPFATEVGAIYRLNSPDFADHAVFNDPTDINYVGMLTEVTGLDSPEVRESFEDLASTDGAVHGIFRFGRRPIVLNGRVFGHASIAERSARLDLARRASIGMSGDCVLSWKPAARRDNLLLNPSFEVDLVPWTGIYTAGLTGTSFTRATSWATSGSASARVQATQPNDSTIRTAAITGGTGTSARPVLASTSYYARADVKHVEAPASGSRIDIFWYKADGTPCSTASSTGTLVGANTVGEFSPTITATSPSDALYAAVRPTARTSTANDVIDVYWDSVMLTEASMGTTYFDGDMEGFYWNGVPHGSQSSDYIGMRALVRRQQPFRESGAWNKDFQIALIAADPFITSTYSHTIVGSGTTPLTIAEGLHNFGNAPAYPVVEFSGDGSHVELYVENLGYPAKQLIGTPLILSGTEAVRVDFKTHRAVFTGGARYGQRAEGLIDWAATEWGTIQPGLDDAIYGGSQTGNYTVTWRDTWI